MLQVDEEPILNDEFSCYSSKQRINVMLHGNCIKIMSIDKNGKAPLDDLQMGDIVGCSVCQGQRNNDTKAYLSIYHYPKIEKKDYSERQRKVVELAYSKYDNFDDNLNVVREWAEKLTKILSRNSPSGFGSSSAKPFLVYINPNSGSGKAQVIFKERVVPLWAEANVPYEVVLTKHQNYAKEEIQKLDLNKYSAILSVSGDGLVYEVLNGLMDREDWQQAIKMPFGQLAGGSGNSYANSIGYLAKEAYNLNIDRLSMHSAFLSCKHDILPIDICAIEMFSSNEDYNKQKSPHRTYSFFSVEWALVADVDLESEKYRFMGGARFTFGGLMGIWNLKTYHGRVSFLPVGEFKTKNPVKILKNGEFKFEPKTVPESTHGPKLKYLRPLDQPVPDDWIIIEENFVLFLVMYMPLLAKDFMAWPDAKLDEGEMLLIFVKEGISRFQLLQLLFKAENGGHLDHPLVEYVRIKAFRLEPLVPEGNIMIDGEHVPYGPIQGEIMPSFANCIAKKPQ